MKLLLPLTILAFLSLLPSCASNQNRKISSTEAALSEPKPKWLCKCKLVRNNSDGSNDQTIKLGNDVVIYDDGAQTCEGTNGAAPEVRGYNQSIYFSWDSYECKEYPL